MEPNAEPICQAESAITSNFENVGGEVAEETPEEEEIDIEETENRSIKKELLKNNRN